MNAILRRSLIQSGAQIATEIQTSAKRQGDDNVRRFLEEYVYRCAFYYVADAEDSSDALLKARDIIDEIEMILEDAR